MRNRKLITLTMLLLTISGTLSAQNVRFPKEGVIQFERKVNVYAMIQKMVNTENSSYMTQFLDQFKKTESQFKVMKSTLYFSRTKTIFKPEIETSRPMPYFGDSPGVTQVNTTFIDLITRQQVTQKKVYEETFLVKDTARTINWKITDETREIAGYSCRRANAVIMDSVYVVAFYTDQIPVSGGPESFNGLPGMILGVALPHENVTWFATAVTDKPVESSIVVAPAKGKPADNKSLAKTLTEALKDWGADGKSSLKIFML